MTQAADIQIPDNPDLAWDLAGINNQTRARDFVLQFEQTLCVYSRAVKQIYSTYTMHFPRQQDRKLVILPDPNAFHDTFYHVRPEGVLATGIYIIPRRSGGPKRPATRQRESGSNPGQPAGALREGRARNCGKTAGE